MEIIFVYALVMKDLRDNLALDAIKYKNGNLPINSKPKRIYMYVCICVCVCVCVCVYIYIYVHTYIHTYIHIYIHMY